MARKILAGFAGVVVAMVLVMVVEKLGHLVYPPPADLDFADADAMGPYVASLPIGALLFVAAAWFIATLGGIVTACRIGDADAKIYAMVIGGLMLVATAFNLSMIPHPVWFSITGVAGIIAAAFLGVKLGSAGPAAPGE